MISSAAKYSLTQNPNHTLHTGQYGFQRTGRTFQDAPLPSQGHDFSIPWRPAPPKGFGLDLDNDGRFDAKKDGFLTFDLNRDGEHTNEEIQQSRNLLKAFSGDFDANSDGRVDFGEYFQGYQNYFQSRAMDVDRDGVLSKWELQRAGGSVVKDRSDMLAVSKYADGQVPSSWESYSLDKLPNGNSLDYLNPWNRSFVSSTPDFSIRPFSDSIFAGRRNA